MSQQTKQVFGVVHVLLALMLMAGIGCCNSAMAEDGPGTTATEEAKGAAAAPASIIAPLDPAVQADTALLGRLQRQLQIKRLELGVGELDAKKRELLAGDNAQGQGEDAGGLSNRIPELLSIYGTGSKLSAEFRVGSALLVAQPGDLVNVEWRLHRVFATGVELKKLSGSETRTLLFGRRASASANAGMAESALRPGAQSPVAPPAVQRVYPVDDDESAMSAPSSSDSGISEVPASALRSDYP